MIIIITINIVVQWKRTLTDIFDKKKTEKKMYLSIRFCKELDLKS